MLSDMSVELVDWMGTDITIVNAARVSFNKHVTESTELKNKDKKLISYLAKNGHWTPFGHGTITLIETVPLFVARQRFKHMVGFCYNEVSRRYVKEDPSFFLPDVWRSNPDNMKQGSSQTETVEWIDPVFHASTCTLKEKYNLDDVFEEKRVSYCVELLYKKALMLYNEMLDAGVCAEQARMVLPQGMLTSYYVTGSLAAWARAYNLRSGVDAQKEIRELALSWDNIIRPLFPISWSELVEWGKV